MAIIAGLDSSIGTGVTLFGLLAVLFTILVNALLKTSSKSDEINARLVEQKDEVIADKDKQIADLKIGHETEVVALKADRDYWFKKYDECREVGRTT